MDKVVLWATLGLLLVVIFLAGALTIERRKTEHLVDRLAVAAQKIVALQTEAEVTTKTLKAHATVVERLRKSHAATSRRLVQALEANKTWATAPVPKEVQDALND